MQFQRQTLTDLIDSLSEAVGNNTVYWTDEEKRDAINEAICVWHVMTGGWVTKIPIETDEQFVSLPSDFVSVQRVLSFPLRSSPTSDSGVPLTMTSLPELDYGSPGWESETGVPEMWLPIGINEIALYPAPLAARLYVIEGLKDAPRLFSPGDFIDAGEEDINLLTHYAHHYLTLKEAGAEFKTTEEGLIDFVEGAALKNAKLKMTAPYRLYMGLVREDGERPARGPRTQVGVRDNE